MKTSLIPRILSTLQFASLAWTKYLSLPGSRGANNMVTHIAYHTNVDNKNMLQNGLKNWQNITVVVAEPKERTLQSTNKKELSCYCEDSAHEEEKTSLFFCVFCESDRLCTTAAGQRNLGQTEGKFILVYGWLKTTGRTTTGWETYECLR